MKIIILLILVLSVYGCSDEECTAPIRDNSPPRFSEIPDTSVFVGDTLTLDVNATDPDNDPITYHMIVRESQNNPPGYPNFEYDNDTGIFIYHPTMDDYPGSDFHFIAIDNSGGIDTASVDIEVLIPNGQYQISFVNCLTFGVWVFLDGEYQGMTSSEEPRTFEALPGTYELYARANATIGDVYFCWTVSDLVIELGSLTTLQLDCTGAECQD